MKSDGGLTEYLVKNSANHHFCFMAITNRLIDTFHIATICSDSDQSRRIGFIGDIDEIAYTQFRSWIKLIPFNDYKNCGKRDIVVIDTTQLEARSPPRHPLYDLVNLITVCRRHYDQIIVLNIYYYSTIDELINLQADFVLLYNHGMKATFNMHPVNNFEWT